MAVRLLRVFIHGELVMRNPLTIDKTYHSILRLLIAKRGYRMKKRIIIIILSIAALAIVLAVVISLIREGFKLPGYF